MLDAFIIERIRKERERARQEGSFIPLHIERPPPRMPEEKPPKPEEEEEGERGSVVIDFSV